MNECTKVAILTFWKIVLEILDTVSKQCVFCWISDFTELKDCLFSFMESLKLSNWTWIREFLSICWSTKEWQLQRYRVVKFQFCWSSVFANQQIQRCHVVKFQFCWISNFCRISKSRDAIWWIPVLLNFQLCRMVTLDMPFDKVSDLLISWFIERAITDSNFLFCRFCMFAKFCLQLWCHLWYHSCNDPTPNMHVLHKLFFIHFRWCETSLMPRKVENAEVWKWKYGSEKKAVYRRLVPDRLTTVPSQRARRLFFSLSYFWFRTSVLHFSIFHLSSHAQFTCSYQSLGMKLLRKYWIAL